MLFWVVASDFPLQGDNLADDVTYTKARDRLLCHHAPLLRGEQRGVQNVERLPREIWRGLLNTDRTGRLFNQRRSSADLQISHLGFHVHRYLPAFRLR